MSESLFTADEVRELVNAAVDRMRYACEEGVLGGVVEPKLRDAAERIKGYLAPLGTDAEAKVYEELSKPYEPVWRPLSDIPRDSTPFVMLIKHTFRWAPYKDVGKVKSTIGKKAQELPDGTIGRWQTLDTRGNWENISEPQGRWRR